MKAVLEAARAARTADEFAAVVQNIEAAVVDAERLRRTSEEAVAAAVFDDGNLTKARRSLADAAADIGTLNAALVGARKRHVEAQAAEEEQRLEHRFEEATAKGEALRLAATRFHTAMTEARETHAEVDRLKREIDFLNGEVGTRRHVNILAIQRSAADPDAAPIRNLSRNGMAIDNLLLDLATPGKAINMPTRRPQFAGSQWTDRVA